VGAKVSLANTHQAFIKIVKREILNKIFWLLIFWQNQEKQIIKLQS
jgi:hypothetical protein